LNGQWTVKEANRLAEKLDSAADDNDKIKSAWMAIYVRQPRQEEVTSAQAFLEHQTVELGSKKAAVAELVRVLFNTNEFLYVD
jgi:hypothetical protein